NKPAAESPATWREFVSTRSTALKITASEMDCSRLRIKNAGLEATFFNDTLRVERLEADLAGRSVVLGPAMLDITNLRFTGRLLSNADPHSVKPLLNAKAAAWLDRFQWRDPPEVEAWVDGPFPPGINLTTNRWSDVLAGWHVEAAIRGREAAYLDVPIASASLKLSLSNSVLRITDFLIMRPEGAAHLQYELEIPTRKFKWEVNGSLNLREISPALGAGVPSVLSAFEFRRPPRVTGTIIGSWLLPRPLACALTINATDLVFRGEPVEKLDAFVSSSNNVVTASNVVIKIGNEWINAPLVKVDLGVPEVSITGLQCCIDPLRVARVIGPEVVAALEPYRFENPPSAFVSGRIAFPKGLTEPDLVFDVAGGPFRFWRLRASEIQGMVHWRRHTLLVTNLAGVLYHGRLAGHVRAELDRTNETSIQFTAQVRNADLALVASELFHHTGRIEGLISGSLNVTNGLATEIDTWTGYGAAQMRDGSLWDLPIFGVLSPVLNTVVPGLGNSKARSANATFTLRDGVVRTDDLLIDAGPAILRYRGSSDLQGNVNARVEAEILASTPLVGPFISFVLTPVSKIFVFQVTGTLAKPKLEPVYVPKFLMLLLRPLHTLRNVLPGGGDTSLPSSSKPSEPRNDNR
ncbi:MAG: AsmA-like C-terminal region-containing protein, partial [Verrucomicrobiae bacterium]|nr:AsmA-like C-terminal region-containing protein [Verrucomicrobiae bacterium]